jgi:hypothetical protein
VKERAIAACERYSSGRMGAVVMQVVSGFSNGEASAFRDAHIAPGAQRACKPVGFVPVR